MSRDPSQAAIARALGLAKSRVTVLKKRGMPVHSVAAARKWRRRNVAEIMPGPGKRGPAEQAGGEVAEGDYASSRALKEYYQALTAKAEYKRKMSKLCNSAEVIAAGAESGTLIRVALESVPDQLAAVLAEGDPEHESRIHALLTEAMDAVLREHAAKLDILTSRLAEPRC